MAAEVTDVGGLQAADEAAAAAAVVVQQQWPVTVKLKHPIAFGTTSYTELVFQRGQLKVLKGIGIESTPTLSQCLMIASRLTNVPTAALELLDLDDSGEVIALALTFFARCLGAGRTF